MEKPEDAYCLGVQRDGEKFILAYSAKGGLRREVRFGEGQVQLLIAALISCFEVQPPCDVGEVPFQ